MPWVIIGDVNELLKLVDKEGGRPVGVSSNNGLANLVFAHGLVDLGFFRKPIYME